MTNHVIDEQVTIYQFPQKIEQSNGTVTIGDLHGNAVKLIHFLLRHGAIKFKDPDPIIQQQHYAQFVTLYEQHALTIRDIVDKKNIINCNLPHQTRFEQALLPWHTADVIPFTSEEEQLFLNLESANEIGLIKLPAKPNTFAQLAPHLQVNNAVVFFEYEKECFYLDTKSQTMTQLGYRAPFSHRVTQFKEKCTDTYTLANEQERVMVADYLLEHINTNKQRLAEKRTENDIAQTTIEELRPTLPEQLAEFATWLETIETCPNAPAIRLIGDEFADRGGSDYFTLKILELLVNHQVNIHINISNHSNEFISAYEHLINHQSFTAPNVINDRQKPSFIALKTLLDYQLIEHNDVAGLIEQVYKPTLRLIDYTLSDTGITLFTHAPAAFTAIRYAADKLHVVYNDDSKESLAVTIDKINTKFQQLITNNQIHQLCNLRDAKTDVAKLTDTQIKKYPLVYLIWNRWTKADDQRGLRPARKNDYNITYIHGHDPYQCPYLHVINLDTNCGKALPGAEAEEIQEAEQEAKKEPDNPQKQAYLQSLKCYKIIDSNEPLCEPQWSLSAIDNEYNYYQQQLRAQNTLFKRHPWLKDMLIGAGVGLSIVGLITIVTLSSGITLPLLLGVGTVISSTLGLSGGLALGLGLTALSASCVTFFSMLASGIGLISRKLAHNNHQAIATTSPQLRNNLELSLSTSYHNMMHSSLTQPISMETIGLVNPIDINEDDIDSNISITPVIPNTFPLLVNENNRYDGDQQFTP